MKPTQITELLANIKASFVSFFSILMFVAMGVGVFTGINWSGPALQAAADKEFNAGSMHNYQISFPYGLTDDDLSKLAAVEGVDEVEATRQANQTFVKGADSYTLKVEGIGERINIPTVLEGALPTSEGEIALKGSTASMLGLNVGDTITFELDNASAATDDAAADDAEKSDDAKADEEKNTSGMKYLKDATFKITGLVESSEYIAWSSQTYGFSSSGSGSVDGIGWVVPSEFDAEAFHDGYPIVNVRSTSLEPFSTFSDEYKAKSTEIEGRISELGSSLGDDRFNALHTEAQKQIDDGQKKLDDADKKIKDGEKQLADAKQQIEDGEKQIADGEAQLESGKAQIADGEAQLAAGKAEYNKKAGPAKKKLDAAKKKLDAAQKEYNKYAGYLSQAKSDRNELQSKYDAAQKKVSAAQAALDKAQTEEEKEKAQKDLDKAKSATIKVDGISMSLTEAKQVLDAAPKEISKYEKQLAQKKDKLDAGRKKYEDAEALFNRETSSAKKKIAAAEAQLADARAQAAAGEAQLAEMKQKLEDGKAEYKEKKKELKQAKQDYNQGVADLEDAKHELGLMKDYGWSVASRTYNGGATEVSVFSGVTDRLSFTMAALFLIVGLLVSYSAVSRIVHEQITQIGTKKALGLRSREVTMSFLAYAGLAVILGAIVGLIVAVFLVETIIGHALGARFIMGDYAPFFGIPLALIITALELVLVLGATWLACRGILKQHAVELLRGEKPPEAKQRFYEKWGIWNKLPLFTQTMVNNCVNDKRRVFSTIVGVAGCTALIVTAVTLNNDVLKSYDMHYDNVYGFNAIAYADGDEAADNVEQALQAQGVDTAQVLRQRFALSLPTGERGAVTLIVPENLDTFQSMYHVNARTGDAPDLSQDGVWMSEAYASHMGAKVGDEVVIDASDGAQIRLKILGFDEFYLTYNEVVMGREAYEKAFDTKFATSAILANTHDTPVADLAPVVESIEGSLGISDDKTSQRGNFDSFSSVSSTVVLIYLALAVLMAIVVLLNLNVMFIEEKKRELIVLMINGFSVKDAKKYIYNDTIVLTIIGIICGLILGAIMGSVTVGSIEPETASFFKGIDGIALIAGVVVSAVLAAIMSFIALRRIPAFKLTDINKF